MGFSRGRGRRCLDRFAAWCRTKTSRANTIQRPAVAAVPHRPCRADFERWPGLRVRPHEQPAAGVPKDGRFVREVVINKETLGSGSVWDVGFSTDPAQTFIYINDGTNQLIYVLDRQTLQVVSTFGGAGHWAGQFYGAHVLAVNSKGDLFIGETYEGKRLQKFTYAGLGAPSAGP